MGGNLTPQHQQQQQQQQQQSQQAGSSGSGAGGSYAGTSGLSKSQQQQVSAGGGGLSLSGVAPTGGMPTAADFSLMLSLGLGLNPADASQLANLDLQKLAMYLVSMKWWDRNKWDTQILVSSFVVITYVLVSLLVWLRVFSSSFFLIV